MIQVYFGTGKGKTTAAAGLALRMLHQEHSVLWVSFLKIVESGETAELQKWKKFKLLKGKYTHPIFYEKAKVPRNTLIRKNQSDLLKKSLSAVIGTGIIVLDEALNALRAGFLPEKDLCLFLDTLPASVEAVLTGRTCPKRLLRRADLVTEFVEVKHYYSKGIPARKGIEF